MGYNAIFTCEIIWLWGGFYGNVHLLFEFGGINYASYNGHKSHEIACVATFY
jgi:hypothetical protein